VHCPRTHTTSPRDIEGLSLGGWNGTPYGYNRLIIGRLYNNPWARCLCALVKSSIARGGGPLTVVMRGEECLACCKGGVRRIGAWSGHVVYLVL